MGLSDGVQIATVGFAAAAAGASWASVWQSRQVLNAGLLPDLHAQALSAGHLAGEPVQSDQPRRMDFVIHNAGGGMAKGAAFVFVEGDQYIMGFIGVGFMRPGDTYHLRTAMLATGLSELATGVVMARDVRERSYVWDIRGTKPLKLRRRGRTPVHSVEAVFKIASIPTWT